MLGCLSKSIDHRSRGVIIPFRLTVVGLHLENCVQFGVCQYRRDIDELSKSSGGPPMSL